MAEIAEADVPKRARELFERGMIALERKNLAYAMDMFMAALNIEPAFLKARKFLRTAGIQQLKATPRAAYRRHLVTLTSIPKLIQGHLALKSAKPQRALQIAEELLRRDPLNLPFIDLLCRAAEAAQMPEIAIQMLMAAREFYPTNPALLIRLGHLFTATNQMDAARQCFEEVVEMCPNDIRAIKAYKDAMARDSMVKGGWTDATREGGSFRDMVKDLKESVTLEQESRAVRSRESVDLLIKDAQDNIRLQPDNINYRRTLANLFVEGGRFDDAIRTIEEARRVSGIDEGQLDQVRATIRLKQLDSAIAQLKENGDLEGAAAKQLEKDAFLFEDVRGRVERYPNDMPLRFEYGVLLLARDQLNEAIQQFQLAQRYPRNRVRALYYLGLCFRQKQQLDLAREQLEKAAAEISEMNALKKDIYYELGGILESSGQVREAVNRYYKEIYQADIGYKDIAAKIEAAYKKYPASS